MSLLSIPPITLASTLLYGAFSRFTHGAYTPSFYAYQIAHAPDDGLATSQITPFLDVLIASGIFYRPTRVWAAGLTTMFIAFGARIMTLKGEKVVWDLVHLGLGVVSVGCAWVERSRSVANNKKR